MTPVDMDEETVALRELTKEIREKKLRIVQEHRRNKVHQKSVITGKAAQKSRDLSAKAETLVQMGLETADKLVREPEERVGRKRARSVAEIAIQSSSVSRAPSMARSKSRIRDRSEMGVTKKLRAESVAIQHKSQRPANLMAKASESDRAVPCKMPKHLFAGKRGMGKTQRR
jgi:nucleolar GTP-binding protein